MQKIKNKKIGVVGLIAIQVCLLASKLQAGEVSTEELITALTTPAKEMIRTRGFKPRANTNADTKVCDPYLNQQLLKEFNAKGEELTRTLYVERAPSIDLDIPFKRAEATLLPEGKSQLDALAKAISDSNLVAKKFVLAGHTDSDGSESYNNKLSCERALSARIYLREKHSIELNRLIPMGFGFQNLKDRDNPQGAVNRRVEIRIFSGL